MEGLEIHRLEASYSSQLVVNNVSLPCMVPGEVVALVGPNAAGKSTLMRSLAGLTPAHGEARLDGDNLLTLSLAERAKRVAFMPQLLPSGIALNVFEGMLAALNAAPSGQTVSNAHLRRRAFSVLEQFGIGDLALRPFDHLNHFIQMPFITEAWCATTNTAGIGSPKLLRPFAHCLMRDDDPSISQHIFDHAKT